MGEEILYDHEAKILLWFMAWINLSYNIFLFVLEINLNEFGLKFIQSMSVLQKQEYQLQK
jgi:hypothetical protein